MIKGTGQRLIPRKLLEWIKGLNKGEGAGLNISTLTDSKGNPRFVEGAGTSETITGVTFTYNKWSLSGSHLMLVLAGTVENGSSVPSGILSTYNIPSFILNKIATVTGDFIEIKKVTMYASNVGSQQTFDSSLKKVTSSLTINNFTSVTLTADRSFRIQYDLLIDTE